MCKIKFLFLTAVSIVFGIMVFLPLSHAEILLGDHFDSQPDWNSSQSSSLLDVWGSVQMNNRGGTYEAAYISATGAHGSSGKGFTQYWDQTTSMGSAQDIWLIKNNINFPNEWYLGYWYKVDTNWDFGSVASLKLLKIHFDNGTTFDINWASWYSSLYPTEAQWPPSGCDFQYKTDEWGLNSFGCWNAIADGNWHYFVWHFNHSEGTISLSIDGEDAANTSNATNFQGSGWDPAYGISFGGNITDGGGGTDEMWTKYDDIVIATTKSEVESFLNVSSSSESVSSDTSSTATEDATVDSTTVFFEETFSDSSLSDRGWYDGGTATATVVNDSDLSSNVLEVSYLSGDSSSQLGQVRHLFAESDGVLVTYKVKYDSNWSWTGYTYGPHEFYLFTNADHDYKGPAYSHSTFYLEMTDGHPRIAQQDGMNVDANYINQDISDATENRSVSGCNGSADGYEGGCYESDGYWYNGRSWDATSTTILSDQWYTIKALILMNDIVDGKGVANGVIKYWVDGDLVMSYDDIILRTAQNSEMKFNQILIGPYFHNGVPYDQKFWIDDVIVQSFKNGPSKPTGFDVTSPQ